VYEGRGRGQMKNAKFGVVYFFRTCSVSCVVSGLLKYFVNFNSIFYKLCNHVEVL
jgi:hypothetical protein